MSQWSTWIQAHAVELPTLVKFVIGLIFVIGVPPLCRRVRLPAVVGLLLCGVLFGPHVIGLVAEDHPVASFLAEIGKLLLMFFAGLEINLALFRAVQKKSITFGITTTTLPLILGTLVGVIFGYKIVPAIVVGSLLASHTLLTTSYLSKVGATRLEPVTITFGATMMSDTLSLVVFAICVQTFVSGFSVGGFLKQVAEIAIFIPGLLFGMSRFGGWALKKVEKDEDAYFILMLALVAVAGLISRSIQLPDIVGAFMAGLSLNAAVRENPVKEKLKFVGEALFIPIFFISIGFLIDPALFVKSITANFWLAFSIIMALLVGKAIAAFSVGTAFHYSTSAKKTMWSLTLPQVAATLAATLVAFKTKNSQGELLLDQQMMNVVLVLVVVTSILGPVLTERFAPDFVRDSTTRRPEEVRKVA